MQPSPRVETSRLLFPSLRFCIFSHPLHKAMRAMMCGGGLVCAQATLQCSSGLDDFTISCLPEKSYTRVRSLPIRAKSYGRTTHENRPSCSRWVGRVAFLISNFYFLVSRWFGGRR